MFEKEFSSPVLAQQFIDELNKGNVVIDAIALDGNRWKICWVENKKYTAVDGKVFDDEVWVTQDGTMIVVQDLELGHAHNIIRMMIREQRAQSELLKSIQDAFSASQVEDNEDNFPGTEMVADPRVLH